MSLFWGVVGLALTALLWCLGPPVCAQNLHEKELDQALNGAKVVTYRKKPGSVGVAPGRLRSAATTPPTSRGGVTGTGKGSANGLGVQLENKVRGGIDARDGAAISIGSVTLGGREGTTGSGKSEQSLIRTQQELVGKVPESRDEQTTWPMEIVYAYLCQAKGNEQNLERALSDWHAVRISHGDGLEAALWYNPVLDKYVMAFEGSTPLDSWKEDPVEWGKDWIGSNVGQALGTLYSQYDSAIAMAQELDKIYKDKDLVFTGHSLGGGLAAASAVCTGRQATTFNAAGVHWLTLAKHIKTKSRADELIDAYNVKGESLSSFQDNRAVTFAVETAVNILVPNPLPITQIPSALGQRHEVFSDETEKMSPSKRHGMDAMLSALKSSS